MTENLTIRTGKPEDVDAMMHIAMLACDENGMSNPDPQKLLGEIWSSLILHRGIIGIIGDPIEAAVLLRIEPLWYSSDDDLSLIERAVFVHPDFRAAKGGRARLLIEWSREVAREMGLTLYMGILSDSPRTEAKVRLYRRQFGDPSGAYWVYRPNEEKSEAA